MQETKRLLAIMAKLRDPNGGCPWDVEQDFASIAPYTLEEAYEVVDAIERGEMDDLREELGDLLLQVVFHSQMAAEAGLFDFEDVARGINEKMVRRHPHVNLSHWERSQSADTVRSDAGEGMRSAPHDSAAEDSSSHPHPKSSSVKMISTSPGGRSAIQTADDQVENWESIKKQEKADKGHSSILDDVPVGLPAMVRAQKLTKRAARVGFDWTEIDDIFAKLQEEIGELREEISPSRERGDNQRIEEELGDLLFVCANLARHLKLDGETALRKANQKFSRRFRYIEDALAKQNKKWEDTSLEAMEALWAEAKENEA
jgi:uncharacterized protein YabN with tetrapyrrole methylase and pyrophosphatase domain